MKSFLRRVFKILAYLAGGVVILLAIAVGLFRLFLPRLPDYQEDIKGWASAAIGMTVEFSGMDARWGLSGPEVEFYDAELLTIDTNTRLVAADEVSVGVGLVRLLIDRKFVVDHVAVRDTSIEVRQLEGGGWWIQGSPLDELLPERRGGTGGGIGRIEVIGEDIEVRFLQPGDEKPRRFQVSRVRANRDDVQLTIDASVELPGDLGRRLSVTAIQQLTDPPGERAWDFALEVDNVDLAGVTAMQPAEAARFDSGTGDVSLSLVFANKRVQSATAEIDIDDIAIAGLADLAVRGRFEFLMDEDGWLVAANELQARTPTGQWPASTLRFEASTDADGKIIMIDAQASYLDFAHLPLIKPWLGEEHRALLADYNPSGVVRDMAVTVTGIGSATPGFNGAFRFENLGIAPIGKRPGVRGFSGSIRADTSGGRLEVDSDSLVVTAPQGLGRPLGFDTATATIIWRRSGQGITLLSDSIVLRNSFFDSESNVEVTFTDGSLAPVVDLNTTFSISDVAVAGDYVPFMPKRPRMSELFQNGMLAGRVPRGRARLYGPMDQFPFENDSDGSLSIDWTVRDAIVKYQARWPVAEIVEADVMLRNMSLLTERNRVINAGNEVVDARLEIANFRQPVMTLSAFAKGTMENFRQLCLQSPIADAFGGQLDRVSVSGDATTSLDLRVPIRDWQSFTFTTEVRTGNAGFRIEGFDAPLTDISGTVTIEREDIRSEALGATFLGEPVSIELEQAPDSMPAFRVVANAAGSTTAEALETELGLPFNGRASGSLDYTARLLFPRGQVEEPSPFTIEIDTDLAGLTIDLPEPLGKAAEDTIAVEASIFMPKGGERIESSGRAGDLLSWELAFLKNGSWDLDRGIASFGIGTIETTAETRGLHLRGETGYVYAQDWFDLAKDSESEIGVAERIRSIDMTVGDLHILGQHLVNHRIRMDRGANEWFVELEGDKILGSVNVPYDFNSGQPIVVEAERLLLPGDDSDDERPAAGIEPRSLPPISIKAEQLALGNRNLGKVEAEFTRTADGLVAEGIVAQDETFEIVGNGSWVIDEADPAGHRSFLTATLTSTDVETTMRRLDYDPGIAGDDLSMLLDLSWSGGPNEHLLETLDGTVKVKIGAGQLSELKPGAGRVFGLMSIAALPRRLALDFRDVFGKGFAFDKINGDFQIVDGETYTCNLSLEGPAADIGIIGRAGLVSREYEQAAVVSASFGNALPVAGAIVAGPQVAAALLIFSQIFKKPLKEVSQVYYGVSGSFDDPAIDSITADEFATSSLMAGCFSEEE